MKFQLRDYQQNASNAAIAHYRLKDTMFVKSD